MGSFKSKQNQKTLEELYINEWLQLAKQSPILFWDGMKKINWSTQGKKYHSDAIFEDTNKREIYNYCRNAFWRITNNGLVRMIVMNKGKIEEMKNSDGDRNNKDRNNKDENEIFKIIPLIYTYDFIALWSNKRCTLINLDLLNSYYTSSESSQKVTAEQTIKLITINAHKNWAEKYYPIVKECLLDCELINAQRDGIPKITVLNPGPVRNYYNVNELIQNFNPRNKVDSKSFTALIDLILSFIFPGGNQLTSLLSSNFDHSLFTEDNVFNIS